VHPQCLIEACRHAIFEEAEERPHGRKPRIARPGLVAAIALEMLEERQNERNIDLLNLDPRRSCRQPARGKRDEQLKAVGIGVTGMRARTLIARQMFAQERREMGSERGHATPPR
jgi:hypothetical protein